MKDAFTTKFWLSLMIFYLEINMNFAKDLMSNTVEKYDRNGTTRRDPHYGNYEKILSTELIW